MKLLIALILVASAIATDLIIPLYQYPAGNGQAWNPILQAVTANPSLNTKIIVNPNSGPGNGLSDPQYLAGSKSLAANVNVQLLGYIHTSADGGKTSCSRPYSVLEEEIFTYSSWVAAGIPIQGVFIDEAPANTANDCVRYMQNLTDLIRKDSAILFPQRQVVFNPGITGTLQPYYDMNPTLISAMETCFVVDFLGRGSWDDCYPWSYLQEVRFQRVLWQFHRRHPAR